MAGKKVKWTEQGGQYYLIINNPALISATVNLTIDWEHAEGAIDDPIGRVIATDYNNVRHEIWTVGSSGSATKSFPINKECDLYLVEFDGVINPKIKDSDKRILIFRHNEVSKDTFKDAIFITKQGGKWGVQIPEGIESGSKIILRMERDDDSKKDGRALTAVELPVGSAKNRMSFSSNTGYETEEETVELDSSKGDFFAFNFEGLDQEPQLNSNGGGKFGDDGNKLPDKPLLEFRDEDGSFNAFLYIKKKNLEVNSSAGLEGARATISLSDVVMDGGETLPPEFDNGCPPGPWEINGVTYVPESYVSPSTPSVDSSSGGIICKKSGSKNIIVDLKNYANKLVTLELTYDISSSLGWVQHFDFNIPTASDIYVGDQRLGEVGNEYNVTPYSHSLDSGSIVFKFHNLDGGFEYEFVHDNDIGPEPERELSELVCTETIVEDQPIDEGTQSSSIFHTFNDKESVNDTISLTSSNGQVGVSVGGESNSGGGNTTANKHYTLTFNSGTDITDVNQINISPGSETASHPPLGELDGEGGNGVTSGISFGQHKQLVNTNKVRVWFTSGPNNSFVRNFTVSYPSSSSGDVVETECECVVQGTETWTQAGGTWPRFESKVYVTKTGGTSVSWVYEDGSGSTSGGIPDDVTVNVSLKNVRNTVPWTGPLFLKQTLQTLAWLDSSTPAGPQNLGGVNGKSLADYYEHSDKIRIRVPSQRRSLTNLKAGGAEMSEFRGAAGAPYEAF